MKSDDPIFTELALKKIAGKATEAEQAQLNELLKQSELAAEFKQLQADTDFAKEVLPVLDEKPVIVPPLTDFELSQMRKLAEQRERKLAPQESKPSWSRRWVLGLASAVAFIVILVVMDLPTPKTVQVAVLDSMGSMRGTNDLNANLMPALKETFGQTNFTSYTESVQLNAWLNLWPNARTVKIVYDRDNGKVRVVYRDANNQTVTQTFPVKKETDLPAVLKQAAESIK